jgi:hypothetical protein
MRVDGCQVVTSYLIRDHFAGTAHVWGLLFWAIGHQSRRFARRTNLVSAPSADDFSNCGHTRHPSNVLTRVSTCIQEGLLFRSHDTAEQGVAMRKPSETLDDVVMSNRMGAVGLSQVGKQKAQVLELPPPRAPDQICAIATRAAIMDHGISWLVGRLRRALKAGISSP